VSEILKDGEDVTGTLADAGDALEVRIAAVLLERAKTEGVSFVGQGGLLAGDPAGAAGRAGGGDERAPGL
jgi:hypothetical protein